MRFLSTLPSYLLATLLASTATAQQPVDLANAPELKVEITRAVQCERSTVAGDTIKVHYRGTLQSDGSEFDNSYTRGRPIEFTLGNRQVITGWDLGLLDMCLGEQRRLTIPPQYAYGQHDIPGIPAGSTLMFDTELMAIEGVGEATGVTENEDGEANVSVDEEEEKPGECRLLGPFALLVQAALGALALLSLVFKRWRETPRRPIKIWAFDASKQVVGSILLHIANLFMSMLSSGSFDLAAKTKAAIQESQPNPCSYYLLNLAIDTTIGIPILVILLRLLHHAFSLTPLARPPQSIKSGHYGSPPRWTWWAKQSLIYFLGLMGMKLCVFFLFQILPWIAWVGDWALRWTEGNEAVQITFVMFIFPLIMNAMQYYIIDIFIKESTGGADGAQYERVGNDEDEEERTIREEQEWEEEGESGDEAIFEDSPLTGKGVLKEANPTTVPVRDGVESSGSSDKRRNGAGGKED